MAIRRPARVKLPSTAYVDPDASLVPDWLSDLEEVFTVCYSLATVTQCDSPGPRVVCKSCSLRELGESWIDLATRTNNGIAKGKYYRDLEREESAHELARRD